MINGRENCLDEILFPAKGTPLSTCGARPDLDCKVLGEFPVNFEPGVCPTKSPNCIPTRCLREDCPRLQKRLGVTG